MAELSEDRLFECISIAHRYEFTFALKHLCDRLIQLIPMPTSSQLQFADRLELSPVLKEWSANCESVQYYYQFARSLAECPVSAATIALFSDVHLKHITRLEEVGMTMTVKHYHTIIVFVKKFIKVCNFNGIP